MRRAPCKARTPVGVPPRLLPGRLSSPRLSLRPCFLGPGLWTYSLSERYSPLPVPVQRCTSRAGHSAGRMMPKPPGSAGDEPPPAGTAPRSARRCHRLASFTGARFVAVVTKRATTVKCFIASSVTKSDELLSRAVPDQVGSALSLRGARRGDEAIHKSEFSALDCFPLAALAVAMLGGRPSTASDVPSWRV
jgi:hypothetical protein